MPRDMLLHWSHPLVSGRAVIFVGCLWPLLSVPFVDSAALFDIFKNGFSYTAHL